MVSETHLLIFYFTICISKNVTVSKTTEVILTEKSASPLAAEISMSNCSK